MPTRVRGYQEGVGDFPPGAGILVIGWMPAAAMTEPDQQPLRICQMCVELLDVTGAGISIVTAAGNRGMVCATDEVAAEIEDAQLTLGEGPCVDAAAGFAPVLVPDLAEPDGVAVDRWPLFMAAADAAGVRAVFALPLRIGAIGVGVLDLYRIRPGGLAAEQMSVALSAAQAAALALLELDPSDGAFGAGARSVRSFTPAVHQATGMVMVQLGIPVEQAFVVLRARAFASGRALSELAADVVARRLRFTSEDS